MSIAHAIFLRVQQLPEDKAQEVLDFANFLSQRQKSDTSHERQAGLLKHQVKIIDPDWHKADTDIEKDFYQ